MSTGSIMKSNGKYFTTYMEKGSAMNDLIDDFYGEALSFAKSAGAATAGWRAGGDYPLGDNAYFNAIMGKEITAAMFSTDNIYTAIGARPYTHEGVRIAYELAHYGLDANGDFVGAGAGITQDGKIGGSYRMPITEVRMPWKEIDFGFDYGLGLMALEHKEDDVIQYKAYVEKMATNFSDLIDKTLLRPLGAAQPTAPSDGYGNANIETSLNGLTRCICSGEEIGKDGWNGKKYVELEPNHVIPFGGATYSDLKDWRGYNNGSTTTHTVNNFDGQVIDLEKGVFSIGDIKRLKMLTSVNWTDMANPNNKVITMSPVAQNKLGALMLANNVHLGQEYVSKDFNGVKLLPGREIGFSVNTFEGLPIMQDGNMSFNYTTKRVDAVTTGDISIYDLDHIWMSILTPIEMFNVQNPLVTGMYQEKNLMHMRCETRIDSFIGHGRIKNIANDE